MASPVRLMRRSIRKTPTGPPPSAIAIDAHQGAPHELEFGEGRDERVKHVHAASGSREGR